MDTQLEEPKQINRGQKVVLTTTVMPAPDRNIIIDCFTSDIEDSAKVVVESDIRAIIEGT